MKGFKLFSRKVKRDSSEVWDQPIDELQKKIDAMTWQEASDNLKKFVKWTCDVWEKHDKEVAQLFLQRLYHFEGPVFNFNLVTHGHLLFRVEDGASKEDIKDEVALHLTKYDKPKVIVEDGGLFRGFAVSPNLVIVGVTAIGVPRECVDDMLAEKDLSLLTEKDARCVNKNWKELSALMKMVNVPNLDEVKHFHLVSEEDNDYEFMCPVWLHKEKRVSYLTFEDPSFVIAKM